MHIVFNPKTSPLGNLSHGNNEITCDQKYLVQNCFLGQKEKRKKNKKTETKKNYGPSTLWNIIYLPLHECNFTVDQENFP